MKFKKVFWGLFFILAAALIIVNQLGLFAGVGLLSLFLTIFLVAILLKSIMSISFVGMLFSLAFLAIVWSNELHLGVLTPWPVLITALLGSIGLEIIFGRHHHCSVKQREFTKETIEGDNSIDINVSFGASTKYITTKTLEKINISCSFGGAQVYLDKAELKDDTATIDLDVSFAGVEIYIPREWNIKNNTNVSLGSVEEKNRNSSDNTKTIIITGKVSLAGVEIIYI